MESMILHKSSLSVFFKHVEDLINVGSLNSLTKPMVTNMAQAFKTLDYDDFVRVIILLGPGRSFCSGVDLTAAEDVFKGDVKDVENDPMAQMELCRKPIIGAIGGFTITTGFEIALACDLLIASKGVKFMDTHARFFLQFSAISINKGTVWIN